MKRHRIIKKYKERLKSFILREPFLNAYHEGVSPYEAVYPRGLFFYKGGEIRQLDRKCP